MGGQNLTHLEQMVTYAGCVLFPEIREHCDRLNFSQDTAAVYVKFVEVDLGRVKLLACCVHG